MVKAFVEKSNMPRKSFKNTKRVAKAPRQTTLSRMAVGPRARRRYDMAVANFREFCIIKDLSCKNLFHAGTYQRDNSHLWDMCLSFYLEHMHNTDPDDDDDTGLGPFIALRGRHQGTELFLGLSDMFPELKHRLRRSHRTLLAWGRGADVDRAPPLPYAVALAICGRAITFGLFHFAACLFLMHAGLLRPMELFKLRVGDLGLAHQQTAIAAKTGRGLSVGLRFETKTSIRHGMQEHVLLEDQSCIKLLYKVFSDKLLSSNLWEDTEARFRETFHMLNEDLALQDIGFRLYSCRRGGASHLFATSRNMGLCVERGRWSSEKSARVYIRDALATQIENQITNTNDLRKHAKILEKFVI